MNPTHAFLKIFLEHRNIAHLKGNESLMTNRYQGFFTLLFTQIWRQQKKTDI